MSMNLTDTYPLTNAQQRIWFMQQMYPESSLMNIGISIKFLSPVQPDLLKQAILRFISENNSTRLLLTTSHADCRGYPRQFVAQTASPHVRMIDVRSEPDPVHNARNWIQANLRKLFEWEKEPLVQFSVLQISSSELWLHLKAHHVIADGAALIYAGRDIIDLYLNFSKGLNRPFQNRPTYLEAAVRETDYIASERYAQDSRYWQEHFQTVTEPVFARTKSVHSCSESGRWETVIEGEWRERVERFCNETGISPYLCFLTAMYAYLYRMTGKRENTIGNITGNRTHPRDKATFGMFANTIAFRYEIDPMQGFADCCRVLAREYARMLRHQKYPFQHLVSRIRERNPDVVRLFDIGIEYQTMDGGVEEHIRYETEPHFSGYIEEEVIVHIKDFGELKQYRVELEYKRSLFEDSEMNDWGGRFIRMLEEAISNPIMPIANWPLLTDAERHQILIEFNDSDRDYRIDETVVELFREQVQRSPEAVALEFGEEHITYRELANESAQLAMSLQRQGIERESIVALMLPRGIDLIVGMMAVLTAGGAYLPIDPYYPEERIRYMLQDSGACVVLTHDTIVSSMSFVGDFAPSLIHIGSREKTRILEGGLMADTELSVLPIPKPDVKADLNVDPVLAPSSADLAYIIYTSGSTGQPKGVLIEHRSLSNLILAIGELLELSERTRMLQFASCSFDASVAEIFPVLCHGGTLVLETREVLQPGESLLNCMRSSEVNTAILSPSLLALLSHFPNASNSLPMLATLVTAGEACPPDVAVEWGEGRKLINGYGPSEAAVWVTYSVFTGRVPLDIGRPIGNKKVYILDENKKPVPIGVTGDIHVGGIGIARGYLNRPEMTTERFIEIDLGLLGSAPARLYRTGDLARYLPDGSIEYVGRADSQVKLRGYRIELEEIEHVLFMHPQVKQAAVIIREDVHTGGTILAAFVLPAGSDELRKEDLRNFMLAKLPRYMVPQQFCLLDRLPLTPSGKVDLRQLRHMKLEESPNSVPLEMPHNKTELILSEIWKDALGSTSVQPDVHFFDLGGDSIRLLYMHGRIREMLDVSITVMDLFRFTTIRMLASYLVEKQIHTNREEQSGANLSHKQVSAYRADAFLRQKRLRGRGR
ncbi:hypothetical protein AZ66_25880 [Paenibacillus sp. E194]|uniref:non-ribosomal peptide synthetase n=1 Tax=Paenibacillus sp. E194 TaxID=1458845 RepID=UPI0005CAB3FC|nr:non-ribosomal peptide synthetase [Paenibacillus sp. E194]KJB85240.1 hypothetical protein AZ66_25880 [Paenibacillus sp. E194]